MKLTMWVRIGVYGAALAVGAVALQWLDYGRMIRSQPGEVYLGLVAAAFLVLGLVIGAKVLAPARPQAFDGNPAAVESLGISPRELAVLRELAAGGSNKEIARRLDISPNTIKTHLARLYEKLGAARRTDAINRARELGILG